MGVDVSVPDSLVLLTLSLGLHRVMSELCTTGEQVPEMERVSEEISVETGCTRMTIQMLNRSVLTMRDVE